MYLLVQAHTIKRKYDLLELDINPRDLFKKDCSNTAPFLPHLTSSNSLTLQQKQFENYQKPNLMANIGSKISAAIPVI